MKIENRRKGSCTTVLVGKKASIDGSTMIARNDDGHEALDPQRFIVIEPENQVRHYKAVLSGLELDLPDNPLRYTSTPNAVLKKEFGLQQELIVKLLRCQQQKQLLRIQEFSDLTLMWKMGWAKKTL